MCSIRIFALTSLEDKNDFSLEKKTNDFFNKTKRFFFEKSHFFWKNDFFETEKKSFFGRMIFFLEQKKCFFFVKERNICA